MSSGGRSSAAASSGVSTIAVTEGATVRERGARRQVAAIWRRRYGLPVRLAAVDAVGNRFRPVTVTFTIA